VKQDSMLKERMLLLEIGEALGYPRLVYSRPTKTPFNRDPEWSMYNIRRTETDRTYPSVIAQSRDGWERFCGHAHAMRIPIALKIARMLHDNGVAKFHPLLGREMMPVEPAMAAEAPAPPPSAPASGAFVDDIEPAKPLSKEEKRARNKAAWAARPRVKQGRRSARTA
jgi:hypothetical protein